MTLKYGGKIIMVDVAISLINAEIAADIKEYGPDDECHLDVRVPEYRKGLRKAIEIIEEHVRNGNTGAGKTDN